MTQVVRALQEAVAAIESLGIDYFVGGSMASIVHGEMRTTQDADVIVHLDAPSVVQLAHALESSFFVDSEFLAECLALGISSNVIHKASGFKLDLFPLRERAFSKQEMARAVRVEVLRGVRMRVATAEDCVLSKLEWYEKGNRASDRQWRDVLGILKNNASSLDRSYLRNWASQLGIAELLHQALTQAGIG